MTLTPGLLALRGGTGRGTMGIGTEQGDQARERKAQPRAVRAEEGRILSVYNPAPAAGGRATHPRRRTGCGGRALPHDGSPYPTVYDYWRAAGTLRGATSIASQSVKPTEKEANTPKLRNLALDGTVVFYAQAARCLAAPSRTPSQGQGLG